MKIETKQVYVSNDGTVFVTKEACLEHEAKTLDAEFQELLANSYYIEDFACPAIVDFVSFKKFVEDNRVWVLQNCLIL